MIITKNNILISSLIFNFDEAPPLPNTKYKRFMKTRITCVLQRGYTQKSKTEVFRLIINPW